MKRISWYCALAAILAVGGEMSGQDYGEHAVSPVSALETNLDVCNVALGGGEDCSYCGECDCTCGSGGWYAGVEATYLTLQPNSRFITFDNDIGNLDDTSEFDYGFEAAPRIWLGYEGCGGWGIRGRYWQYDAEANVAEIDFLDPVDNELDAGFFSSSFEAYTIDLEVTRRFHRGCWDLMASVGARHASIAHAYLGQEHDHDDGDVDDADMMAHRRRFDGTGVTVALEGARDIGCRNLAAFWSLRGSAIFGDNKAAGVAIDIDDDDIDVDADASRQSDDLFILDAQVGLEWSQPIECMDGFVFIRGAFEYQFWDLDPSTPLDLMPGSDFTRIDSLGRNDVDAYGVGISAGIVR